MVGGVGLLTYEYVPLGSIVLGVSAFWFGYMNRELLAYERGEMKK